MDFSAEMVATFIAVVGILSVVAQTALLSLLMKKLSNKHVIMVRNNLLSTSQSTFSLHFAKLLYSLIVS